MSEFNHHQSIEQALTENVRVPLPDIRSYEMLSPRNDDATRPTPLDPFHFEYLGSKDDSAPYSINELTYLTVAGYLLDDRMQQASRWVGLDHDDPSDAYARAASEIKGALFGRARRNDNSYTRLMEAIKQPGREVDGDLYEIIQAARVGHANLPQLVRLLKEYPEMVSVEVFKYTKPFDVRDRELAKEVIDAKIQQLQTEFWDAEVLVPEQWEEAKPPFIDRNGVLVRKYRAAAIRSHDSSAELIVKTTDLIVPHTLRLETDTAASVVIGRVTAGDNEYAARLLPLGTTAYLRTADCRERAGYTKPDMIARGMGATSVEATLKLEQDRVFLIQKGHGEVIESIPERMRPAYITKVAASLRQQLQRTDAAGPLNQESL